MVQIVIPVFRGDRVKPVLISGIIYLATSLLLILGWWEIAIIHLVSGLIFCITIVGIPWGLQHFKMAIGAIFPFGKEIR